MFEALLDGLQQSMMGPSGDEERGWEKRIQIRDTGSRITGVRDG